MDFIAKEPLFWAFWVLGDLTPAMCAPETGGWQMLVVLNYLA
jgi:hypothetical protein